MADAAPAAGDTLQSFARLASLTWLGSADDGAYGTSLRKMWFAPDPDLDRTLADAFSGTVEQIADGAADKWFEAGSGVSVQARLGALLCVDQFSRNVFRGTARAFAADPKALTFARALLAEEGFMEAQPTFVRMFVLLPFQHSEELAVQEESLRLHEQWVGTSAQLMSFARKHHEMIEKFGRFPHRNELLGRTSTPEEVAWIAAEGSYGQSKSK